MLIRNYSESKKFKLLREVSQLHDPSIGPWAYDTWQLLNEKYFNGELKVGPIVWGLTVHGTAVGYYTEEINKITLHPSILKPFSRAWRCEGLLGEKMAEDILLHEMVHQNIFQVFNLTRFEHGQCHNFGPWCDEINRLNPMMELQGKATMSTKRRVKVGENGSRKVIWIPQDDGTLTKKQLCSWPNSLRPIGYYETTRKEKLVSIIKMF